MGKSSISMNLYSMRSRTFVQDSSVWSTRIIRTAIREVSASTIPQLHEVARVLKHMATIAATDQSSTPVIDFEEEEKKLHITDPFFAFYLRWGELAA